MKKVLLLITVCIITSMQAQDPIFNPSLSIISNGNVDSPVGEEVDKIIDGDVLTKFLDFLLNDGMTFTVDLGGDSAIATSISFTTANDFQERDPMQFEVLGSNDGSSFTSIATDDVPCVSDRFFEHNYDFVNTETYRHYQVAYTNACDPSGGSDFPSIQIAETQLFGELLSVSAYNLSEAIHVYPNPSDGAFTIDNQAQIPINTIDLMDMHGKLVQRLESGLQTQFVSRSDLQTGIYFLRLTNDTATEIKRLIIK
ncbi:MAG: hypothetical protein ACI828_002361 [Flavobacteriales bacterium]|jgi:hypothetical protein